MKEFALASAAFLAAHSVPALPGLRAHLIARLGRGAYLAVYSASSVILLAWLVLAARRAETVVLWEAAAWQWYAPLVLMPISAILLVAGATCPNPLSVSFRSGPIPGPVTAVTRHPILWAFLVWGLAHIPPNGDLVSLVLFGGMAVFSLAGIPLLDAKARRRLGDERWGALAGTTSVLPFAALLSGRAALGPVTPHLAAATAGLALYAWFVLHGHELLIGVDPLAFLRPHG